MRRRRIDPTADRPIYRQLADLLRADIHTGRLRPGQMLPSEAHLQEEHEVSLNSVRAALGQLRAEGLVVTQRGRGTRVRRPEDVQVVEVTPGARITSRPCTQDEARRHGLAEGTNVLVVEQNETTKLYAADQTELHTVGNNGEGDTDGP